MKLIDLDQQIFVPITDETKGGATYEIQTTVGEFFKGCCDEFAPEVIEAIPVEWLKAHKTECFDDWGEEPVSVEAALRIWQKEQEVQDG